jgi:hypothetical protein
MRNLLILSLAAMFLTACAGPAATSKPTATLRPAAQTPSPTAISIPTDTSVPATETAPETNELVKGVEEEQKEALNKYFWEEIFFPLNEGSGYFQEFGIVTVDDFSRVVQENDGYLPASSEGNKLTGFGSENYQRRLAIVVGGVQMDKPLKIDLGTEFLSPDDLASTPLPNGLFYPNVDVVYETTDPGTSAQEGIVLLDKGKHRELTLFMVWRLQQYDLDGRKFDGSTDQIDEQADKYARELMYFAWMMVHPEEAKDLMSDDFYRVWNTELKKVGDVEYEGSLYFSGFREKLINGDYDVPEVFDVD